MIYLDTHVVVWLYGGLIEKISDTAKSLINQEEIYISPIVRLELQYLYEIERVTVSADDILNDLSTRIGLNICQRSFNSIITQALTINWTRDPFDRLIVANALINYDILITKDNNILANYHHAKW
ncbi:type II toxin-antitoxin system VapC family toxin [Geminocystis herdmanii]|uniref:type II toxin-antitoxin system VapC family toxin n=1 Tax=Geminocystis herdmanii TaxID=669359 RepID=UPI00034CDAA0|nr:PIN domain-containing protein [Geminocystis herdmanii]